jgi:zinc protease
MARPIIGRQDALQALTAKDIRAYWNTHYLPANATFALAGDLPFEQALELIDRATAQWKPARTTARRPSAPVQDVDGRVAVQNMPARQETVLALASAVGPWKSLNVPAISVLATLAGDGEGSLITRDLVRRRGVLVSGGSLAWLNRDAGAIGFTGTVRPSGLARGVTSLLKLAEQLKKSPSQSDFQRATGFVRGDILRQWLRPLDVAVQLCQQALLGDSEIGPLHDLEALAKVTPQHLTELAETLFERDALRIAAAGPVDPNGDLSRLFAARIG